MAKQKQLEFHTEQRKVSDLVPYDLNPRLIGDKEKEDLEASLKKFGLAEIPVVDADNVICAGHQRMEAMVLLDRGDEIIDVRVPNRKMTEEEFYEYNIRSNKNTGKWNFEMLNDSEYRDRLMDWGFEAFELMGQQDELAFIDEDLKGKSDNRGGVSTGGYKFEIGGFTQYYKEDSEEAELLLKAGEAMMELSDEDMNAKVREICSAISNS